MLTRYRVQLMGDRTREIVRLELMLEDASIKLSSVASSLKTVSARAMLTAMINGETDPVQLADLAKGRMRRKIPDLAQALTGTFDVDHAQLAKSMLRRLELVELALAELDAVIVEACRPWQHQIELLQTIPGVGETVAQVIVAETGADMTRFPSAAHLAAWAGLAPAMHESAGRQTPAGKRHGNKWLTAMLVEAAGSVGRMHGCPDARVGIPECLCRPRLLAKSIEISSQRARSQAADPQRQVAMVGRSWVNIPAIVLPFWGTDMKTIGIVGGIAWPSTMVYYRIINELVAQRSGDSGLHSASLVLAQTDFEQITNPRDGW